MSLLKRITTSPNPSRMSLDEYGLMLGAWSSQFGGYAAPFQQTLGGQRTERPTNSFEGLAQSAYAANGVVFACMLVRQLAFSPVRFTFQRLRNGSPSDTFGDKTLRLLERPWPGGTTQDLLSRMIQDADLAGNSYWVRKGDELVRLRPDWVQIVGAPRTFDSEGSGRGGGQVGWTKVGYLYTEGGFVPGNKNDAVAFTVDEVAHYAPIPDPLGVFCGMSWLTPILREIQADQAMTRHQRAYMDNGATVNMVVKHAIGADRDAVAKWQEAMESRHVGPENAYKNLNLYPGADVTVVGSNLQQIDFKKVRGSGETRIAAAANVPPIIVGLSEGLEAATYSNYGQARRRFADGTMHPLWQNAAGSLENVVPPPDDASRLWYDASDVPFLREDEADAANIAAVRASTVNTYITAGFTPDSAVKAVDSGDINLLVDSGLRSVQLLPPGTPTKAPSETNYQPPLTLLTRNADGSTSLAIEAPLEPQEDK